jgi:hypothetical protein
MSGALCVHSTHCNIQLFMQFSVVISPRAYRCGAQHFFPPSQEYYKNISGKNDAPRRRYLTDCRMVCSIQFGSLQPSWSCLGAILCRGWGVLARRACIIILQDNTRSSISSELYRTAPLTSDRIPHKSANATLKRSAAIRSIVECKAVTLPQLSHSLGIFQHKMHRLHNSCNALQNYCTIVLFKKNCIINVTFGK